MSSKKSKIASGSIIILIGSFVFRIGGFIYRFIMSRLLDTAGYGILGLTLPFQNLLTITANGGLPPAIAKYVAQYSAVEQDDMVRQIIVTSLKIVAVTGTIGAILMYILAGYIAIDWWHKPEALLPLQIVAVMAPFSVIVGVFRGVFQGYYKMTNILITRAFEQIFSIAFAIILVVIGWYVAGAVVGTAIGFMASAAVSIYLFRKQIWSRLNRRHDSHSLKPNRDKIFTLREELGIASMLIKFSVPVVITGLAEMCLYDIGTILIGVYLASQYAGYYTNASAIARLPLIISTAVATSVLPATSEALSLRDGHLLQTYISQSYRYVGFFVVPMCAVTIIFAAPIIALLFGEAYIPGAGALQIFVIGMVFFTIYNVSSSICQGLGRPFIPMIALIVGTAIELVLSVLLIPSIGIEGAATGTTVAAFIIMVITLYGTFKLSKVNVPVADFTKIIMASFLMGVILMLLPKTIGGFLLSLIAAPLLYALFIAVVGGLRKEDITVMHRFAGKFGPAAGILHKLIGVLERFAR